MNSRPLTHVSCDSRDMEALTPNHFLLGSSSGQLILPRYDKSSINLREQWELSQFYAHFFWTRWIREYLPTLHSGKKWHKRGDPLKVGDIVLIMDNEVKRNEWRKGIVTNVMPGRDGEVRMANVQTEKSILSRPSNKSLSYLYYKFLVIFCKFFFMI